MSGLLDVSGLPRLGWMNRRREGDLFVPEKPDRMECHSSHLKHLEAIPLSGVQFLLPFLRCLMYLLEQLLLQASLPGKFISMGGTRT
jgi:hypothetical protein